MCVSIIFIARSKTSTHHISRLVDEVCDWSLVKQLAQWWTRSNHLKMMSTAFSVMDEEVWSKCPATTNAVERIANLTVYFACLKHLAAEHGLSLSY